MAIDMIAPLTAVGILKKVFGRKSNTAELKLLWKYVVD
jgi:hypothetical protein